MAIYNVCMNIGKLLLKGLGQTSKGGDDSSSYKQYYTNFSPILLRCMRIWIWKLRALPRDTQKRVKFNARYS